MKLWFGSFQEIFDGKYNFKHDVSFNGVRQVHFIKSEWESFTPAKKVSNIYLIYRGLVMLALNFILFFGVGCSAILEINDPEKEKPNPDPRKIRKDLHFFLVFLTHWSIITQALYSAVYFAYLVMVRWKYNPDEDENVGVVLEAEYKLPPSVTASATTPPNDSDKKSTDARSPKVEVVKKITDIDVFSSLVTGVSSKTRIIVGHHEDIDPTKLHTHSHPYFHIEHDEILVDVFERIPGDKIVVEPLPTIVKIIWFLFNCTTVLPSFVTLGYWGILFSVARYKEMVMESWCSFPSSATLHGANMILFYIDFMVVAIPFRLGHVVHICVYGYVYSAFTGLYEFLGGHYWRDDIPFIYPFLNWRQSPGFALMVMYTALLLGTIVYSFNTLLYSFRLWLVSKFKPGAKHEHEYKYEWIQRSKHSHSHSHDTCCNCFSSAHNNVTSNEGTSQAVST